MHNLKRKLITEKLPEAFSYRTVATEKKESLAKEWTESLLIPEHDSVSYLEQRAFVEGFFLLYQNGTGVEVFCSVSSSEIGPREPTTTLCKVTGNETTLLIGLLTSYVLPREELHQQIRKKWASSMV